MPDDCRASLLVALERLVEWRQITGGFDSSPGDQAREAIAKAEE